MNYHQSTFGTLGNDTFDVVFDNPGFQAYANRLPFCQGPWVLFLLITKTSGVSEPTLQHSGLEIPRFLTDGPPWLVGAVLEQWRADRFSAAVASERESLRLWSVRARRPFRSNVVKALLAGLQPSPNQLCTTTLRHQMCGQSQAQHCWHDSAGPVCRVAC